MKYYIAIFQIILLISCINKKDKDIVESKDSVKEIIIKPDYDQELPYDSIIESVKLIPLETNQNCLIRDPFKVVIKNDLVFVQNFLDNLLVFDINGKFIRKIGNQGKGPYEYIRIYDFDIDMDMNIHICDGMQVLIFSFKGDPIKSIKLDVKKDGVKIYPQQFSVTQNGGYYLWAMSGPGQAGKEVCFFNQIDKDQKIIDELFPIKKVESSNSYRFQRFGDYINIVPYFGIYTIYAARENGIKVNYHLNFGERTLKDQIPEWDDFKKFRQEVSNRKYVTRINCFIESDNWTFFQFIYLNYCYIAFYSKTLNRTFVNLPKPGDPPNKLLVKFYGELEGKMIGMAEPSYLLEKLKLMKSENWQKNLSAADYQLMKQIEKIILTDNPVLIVYEMKNY